MDGHQNDLPRCEQCPNLDILFGPNRDPENEQYWCRWEYAKRAHECGQPRGIEAFALMEYCIRDPKDQCNIPEAWERVDKSAKLQGEE
jgi:hypothetical protein